MREYTPHKDGRPRFFQLDNGDLLIADVQGIHLFHGTCKRLVFEYLDNGMHTVHSCNCPAITIDDLLTQLLLTMDQCQDIESAKRMLLMFKAQRDMTHVR